VAVYPDGLRYTKNHEWLDAEGRVGITDYAQHSLGDVVFVELPEEGRRLAAGESFGTVESVKSAADVYAPVAGTVVAVNSGLKDHPEWINEDPYGRGWMIRLSQEEAGQGRVDAESYRRLAEGDGQ
jgi:glycine cleavage system H protein